jgi:hypothetical protein
MKSQKPATGIMETNNFRDAKVYRVACECGDANHDHNVWVEADDSNTISVTIYTQQKSKWWAMNRWQKIWTLLTKGYIEYETSIILKEQQAVNYAEALKSAAKDIAAYKLKN